MRFRKRDAVRGVKFKDEGIHIAHFDQLMKYQDSKKHITIQRNTPRQTKQYHSKNSTRNFSSKINKPLSIYKTPCASQSTKPPTRMPSPSPRPLAYASPSPSLPLLPSDINPSSYQTAPSRLLRRIIPVPHNQPSLHTAPLSSLHPPRKLLDRAAGTEKDMQRWLRT